MKETLIASLKGAGQPVEVLSGPDGSEVLILPHGGRVLGLFTADCARNFFWTNPDLASAATARRFFESEAWRNSGGDRTWLAPEVDFFFPDFPDTSRYWQPRQLDPGNYQIEKTTAEISLSNRLTARLSRSSAEVELLIRKTVSAAANPLRFEHLSALSGIAYAGYTLRTSLEWTGGGVGSSSAAAGLWNLLQLPHGGDLLIPTHARALPRTYFGAIPPDDLVVGDHLVCYKMRAAGEQKIGIRAAAVAGRLAYRHQTDDGVWALIVRNVFINPSGSYVDIPWNGPAELGDAVQGCNINSGLGRFSEVEYHVPAIGPATGRFLSVDVSQVWAFRGARDQIDVVTRNLVSASCPPSEEKEPRA